MASKKHVVAATAYTFLELQNSVPDTEWSFQDGGLYIVKKVGVKILTIIVLYSLS
jgi:predicted thioredoxin/glutaredoxin